MELKQVINRSLNELFGALLFGINHDKLYEFGVVFSREYTRTLGPVPDEVNHFEQSCL